MRKLDAKTQLLKSGMFLAGAIASVVLLLGANARAQNILAMENGGTVSSYTISSGPIVTAIGEMPGYNANAGHTYTYWAYLAADSTGSMEVYCSSNNAVTLGYTPTVGDSINVTAAYSPYHGIPEMEATFTSITLQSSGNTVPAPPIINTASISANTLNGVTTPYSIAGYYCELPNVYISGGPSVFPNYAGGNTTWTLTDSYGTSTLYDWVTTYSACGNMGGTAVPTGEVDIYGFVDAFNEMVPFAIVAVPEPTTLALIAVGLVGMLAIRRRHS